MTESLIHLFIYLLAAGAVSGTDSCTTGAYGSESCTTSPGPQSDHISLLQESLIIEKRRAVGMSAVQPQAENATTMAVGGEAFLAVPGQIIHWLAAMQRPIDRSFTLLRGEDKTAWLIFALAFLILLLFDNAIIFARPRRMGFKSAVVYTLFWTFMALVFCIWLGWFQSPHSSYMWASGYTLQWMMSFDNLFVFHLIFKVYKTPDELKHVPLFFGIVGQAVFTFSLLTFGEYIFHKLYFLHIIFGLFFIYIGAKQVIDDDEDDDPTQNPVIQWLQENLPFVAHYDTEGHFFVRLPVDVEGKVYIPRSAHILTFPDPPPAEVATIADTRLPGYGSGETDPLVPKASPLADVSRMTTPRCNAPTMIDTKKIDLTGQKTTLRATMLFLVVCTLEISDVIFSIDTIVAVSVQVPDLYLAFTCVAFALLTLRATFFIMEVLVQMFSLVSYAIGAILIYIGVKLLIDRWILVPHLVDLIVLIGTFGCSIIASAIYDRAEEDPTDGSAEKLLSGAVP